MKREVILRWLIKGESDLKSAKILLDAADVLTDIVCFHSQQAVEKYLKAFLTDKDVRFEKIHDLRTLLELCIREDRDFEKLDKERISKLSFYAVDLRYPDEFYIPSIEEARNALNIAAELKEFILKKLKVSEKELQR